ncbi:catalase [Nocardioides sp. AX2bis]|uniref:catalase n=1 Tax=Nocardioides sp. AX2bis TaxID=2653157 RepID=UPI0012F3CE31|nr:catalase [Nocardioides sp. AX2bis]VXB28282.1 Catalase HPII [Nocardioides sp. AX2bis]
MTSDQKNSRPVPGAPASEPPTLEQPTTPRETPPPKPDQAGPRTVSPTGQETGNPAEVNQQGGAYLTTATGTRVRDTDHSLKAGPRGPTLLQDHHLREKMMHFDHERIPERVVHARGAAAHGTFTSYGTADNISRAAFLAKGAETPVFVRFSTVLGSRGSADTVRDTRGFATKFYTSEGNFDLVGNNIPVFFIQDGIKFPDVIHAGKPHPDREIPQAQSAHDTFWDFVSLHTEAQHHTIWNMSDRGIARSYRMMEGFGVHTFRMVDADGATSLVKLHWKPKLGVHSLVWEEALLTNGIDPDFHRRDLADAIEAGAYPSWELGLQVFPDTDEQFFEGIDLLDPTKLVPEELAPVQPVGEMVLHKNASNYFAETEQVAFHTGHLVPGIDGTDDPLLQARNFSYLDTQLSRLGGPNFDQLPINRPHVPVNDMLRDGMHQSADHRGVAAYQPNTIDGGCPFMAGADMSAYEDLAVTIPATRKVRENPASFDDHYSQARMFWRSLSPVEQHHTAQAYAFELGKVFEQVIKERQLLALANIDTELCQIVANGLGLPAPAATVDVADVDPSPALSQVGGQWPVDGRIVGLVVDATGEPEALRQAGLVQDALVSAGLNAFVIAEHGGQVGDGLVVQRTFATVRSVELDAVLLVGCPAPGADLLAGTGTTAGGTAESVDPRVVQLVQEAYRHCKSIGAWGAGATVLDLVGIGAGPGVVVDDAPDAVVEQTLVGLAGHRSWDRFPSTL